MCTSPSFYIWLIYRESFVPLGIILYMRPTNETLLQCNGCLIGWSHTQNDPWSCIHIHQGTQETHLIAPLWEWDMGCLSWVHFLTEVYMWKYLFSQQLCITMKKFPLSYMVVLMTAPELRMIYMYVLIHVKKCGNMIQETYLNLNQRYLILFSRNRLFQPAQRRRCLIT